MSREARLGLLVLGAFLLVYLTATWIRGTGLFQGARQRVPVAFAHVSGLRTSDEVTIRGVQVGQVIDIVPTNHAVIVWLELDPAIRLQQNASARILVKEILGGKLVELDPGQSSQKFAPGDTIQGLPVFDIPTAIEQFGSLFRGLDTAQVRRLLVNLDGTTRNLAQLTGSIQPEQLQRTTSNLESAAASLNRQLTEAERRQVVADADALLADIRSLSHQLASTARRIDSLTPAIASPAADAAQEAKRLMTRANGLLDSLTQNQTVVGKLLTDPQFARKLEQTLDGIEQTLRYVREDSLSVGVRLGRRKRK